MRSHDAVVVRVTEFNDPGCPFGYSAEPWRRKIEWLYGDAIEIDLRLVGLIEDPEELTRRGLTPERMTGGWKKFSDEQGMPFSFEVAERNVGTVPACAAVVAARVNGENDRRLMRWLRIHRFRGELVDTPEVIAECAIESGIDPEQLAAWIGSDAAAAALAEDMRAARSPSSEARALDHKLGGPAGERRYTCPSWEVERVADGRRISAPGFQSLGLYEAAIANLAPELERRPAAESATVVLEWAGEPIATREVAAIMEVEDDVAAEALRGSGAQEIALETGSFWRAG